MSNEKRRILEIFEYELIKTECGGIEVIDLVTATSELINDNDFELKLPQSLPQGEWMGVPVRLKIIKDHMFAQPFRQKVVVKDHEEINKMYGETECGKHFEIFPIRDPKNLYNFATSATLICCKGKTDHNCGRKKFCITLNDAHEFVLHKNECKCYDKRKPCGCEGYGYGYGYKHSNYGFGYDFGKY